MLIAVIEGADLGRSWRHGLPYEISGTFRAIRGDDDPPPGDGILTQFGQVGTGLRKSQNKYPTIIAPYGRSVTLLNGCPRPLASPRSTFCAKWSKADTPPISCLRCRSIPAMPASPLKSSSGFFASVPNWIS